MGSIILYNATVFTGVTKVEHSAVVIEDGVVSDVFSRKRFEQKRFPHPRKPTIWKGHISAPVWWIRTSMDCTVMVPMI
jgi:N-acetylglucosamine-6-phosphate deacetylase